MSKKARQLVRLGMLVSACFLFIIAFGGPFQSPVTLEPVMDMLAPDYHNIQDGDQMAWWLYPIAMIPLVGLVILALMVVLFTYSVLTKRGWDLLARVLGLFKAGTEVFNRHISLPYGRMLDRLLLTLILTTLVMGAMGVVGVSYESAEQKAALFLASFLTVTAIFQNQIVLLRGLEA